MPSSQQAHSKKNTLLGAQLPINIEAEKAVLSSILLNGDSITLVSDIIKPQDFYKKAHQIIYQTALDIAQDGKSLDAVILYDELVANKLDQDVGGIEYLLNLQENISAVGLIAQHATIIKKKSVLRSLIQSAGDIINRCYEQQEDEIETVLDNAEKKIYEISNNLTAQTFTRLDLILKKTFQELSDVKNQKEGVTGITSGFNHFDLMTSGMQKGDLLILAARPSMGKTALALNIALNACKSGAPVGIFSLEMSSEQLALRMLSSESGIPHQKIRNALVSPGEWMSLTNHAALLAESKIFVDDTATLNIMELRAKARKLKAKEDIQLLVIDYLQLINAHGRHENRNQEISAISRALKALAKELDIPVLALSQLSRSLENRVDKRPMLSDLRESGAIEQDGDVIFFIYRDVVYNPETEHPSLTEIIIGKQRNGPVGTFHVNFNGSVTRFEDMKH